jgi:hypothetical protein
MAGRLLGVPAIRAPGIRAPGIRAPGIRAPGIRAPAGEAQMADTDAAKQSGCDYISFHSPVLMRQTFRLSTVEGAEACL